MKVLARRNVHEAWFEVTNKKKQLTNLYEKLKTLSVFMEDTDINKIQIKIVR